MKGVIFTGVFSAAAIFASPAMAAAIGPQMVIADLQLDTAKTVEPKEEHKHESLLHDVERSQRESLMQRQMLQLEQLRRQAERDAARAEKLKRLKRNS
ncbi:hypothetical protein [Microbulbifer taiwanensis]|uniref:Uncharacterized protein n=1 Tax=Microbulbifer taiwanensis TaxID=986746 RepID=A0ABW1YRE2_9GAMM|nr:hypothetical protein [Microbulbifer taiwanensis]